MKTFASLMITLVVLFAAVSCEHKELCYYHPHTAPVRVNVDWSRFTMETPTGMTAYAYPFMNSEVDLFKTVTHDIDNITLDLEAGFFNTLIFNQSESEFGTLEFINLEDYASAQVKVLQVKSSWYVSKGSDTKVGTEPEWFAVGRAENVEVTEEMVRVAEEEFLANHRDIMTKSGTRSVNDVAVVTPLNVIKQVQFEIHAEGLYNLRAVRAALEGMAEGCYLSTGKNTSEQIAYTMEEWSVSSDKNDPTSGYISTTLSTFGLPLGHTGTPEENKFSISLLLVDNKTVLTYDYYIGDILIPLLEEDGADGLVKIKINLELPERLPDVMPLGGQGGGFEADVEGWGEEIETEIPIM